MGSWEEEWKCSLIRKARAPPSSGVLSPPSCLRVIGIGGFDLFKALTFKISGLVLGFHRGQSGGSVLVTFPWSWRGSVV